jgi:formamidopyrimidine-DNA glycosylase
MALGPDPVVDGIDVDRLVAVLKRTKRTIKETLLDQRVLAGIGNIHAVEALWHARIDPRRPAKSVSLAELKRLTKGIDRTIAHALAHAKGDEITYVEDAGAENPFYVYGRGGEPCPRCKTALSSIVLGGRTTVFLLELPASSCGPQGTRVVEVPQARSSRNSSGTSGSVAQALSSSSAVSLPSWIRNAIER